MTKTIRFPRFHPPYEKRYRKEEVHSDRQYLRDASRRMTQYDDVDDIDDAYTHHHWDHGVLSSSKYIPERDADKHCYIDTMWCGTIRHSLPYFFITTKKYRKDFQDKFFHGTRITVKECCEIL